MFDDRGRYLKMKEKHGKGPFLNPAVFSPMPVEVLSMEISKSPLVCQCTGKLSGYSNPGEFKSPWWIHAACGKPTFLWIKAMGDTVLNFFVGGPLNEMAYTTSTLLSDTALHSLVTEYEWTIEVRNSASTGRIARVWMHKVTQVCGSVAHDRNNNRAGGTTMTDQTTQESQAPETAQVDTSGLAEARGSLKVSRQKVADATNGKLTVAKVWRLEQGAGRKNTQEEVDAYKEALRVLEAQASEKQAAENTEGTADPS